MLADYWLEHASKQISAEALKTRLAAVQQFIDADVAAGRLQDPVPPEMVDEAFVKRFRAEMLSRPITARRKDARGNWIAGKQRKRSASTVEGYVVALKSALNHAVMERRIRPIVPVKSLSRSQVTPVRKDRASIDAMAEMLSYAAACPRRRTLLRYLAGAFETLARPDSILDISVKPERMQWLRSEGLLDLNPAGRIQTKKHRPVVRVSARMAAWLAETDEWLVCRELQAKPKGTRLRLKAGEIEPRRNQVRAASIRQAWDTMKADLGLPATWAPKFLRHSMSTHLRGRGVDPLELAGQMGHKILGTSEIYAIYDPNYLRTVHLGIADIVSDIERVAKTRLHPSCTQLVAPVRDEIAA